MRYFNLTTLSIFIFLLCISISFTFHPGIVLANNAQGNQDPDLSDFKKQLELMEETIKKQQEMINALKEKIESKEMVSHNSASEIETSEIEQVIDEYLTKEDTREKMSKAGLTPGIEVGYKKGFYIKTRDDRFYTKINNRMQFKFQYNDKDIGTNGATDEDVTGFDLRRIRTKLSGHAYGDIKYKFEFASSGDDVEIKDAWFDVQHISWANVLAGQFKVFNRQFLASSGALQMIDRSQVSETFRFWQDEYKRGVAIHSKEILDGKIDYMISVQNPEKRYTDNTVNTLLYIARASYYPFGPYNGYKESDYEYTDSFKAHIGGGFGFQQIGNSADGDSDEIDHTQFLGELGFKYKGFSFVSEYHNRKRTLLDALETGDNLLLGLSSAIAALPANTKLHDQGFFAQAGYMLVPKRLELTARYDVINYDNEHPEAGTVGRIDNKSFYTAGINYFLHGRDHKIQANFIHENEELSGTYFGENNETTVLTQYMINF
jgi:regulator of replication initiation timing